MRMVRSIFVPGVNTKRDNGGRRKENGDKKRQNG